MANQVGFTAFLASLLACHLIGSPVEEHEQETSNAVLSSGVEPEIAAVKDELAAARTAEGKDAPEGYSGYNLEKLLKIQEILGGTGGVNWLSIEFLRT